MSMRDNILKLRHEGKSYNEIQSALGCSKSTISYHCGAGQKHKTTLRRRGYYQTVRGIFKRKKDNFSCIRGNRQSKGRRVSLSFSSKEFRAKLEANPFCYLTGRPIDLLSPKTYHCDHVVPVSKGGKSTLDNLGLLCKDVNMAKGEMSVTEFLGLCKEVLLHNGYKVELA